MTRDRNADAAPRPPHRPRRRTRTERGRPIDPAVDISLFSRILDLAGAGMAALLGGILARALRLDPVGVATIAIISGLGGGIVRDTLMQKGTPVAFTDSAFVIAAIVGAALAFLLPIGGRSWDRIYPWIDALVLGCWSAAGADRALAHGFDWLPALLLGATTGVGGGVVRDVLLRRMPGLFRGGTLYATSALAASGTMIGLSALDLNEIALAVSTAVGAALTLLARERGWSLPTSEGAVSKIPGSIGRATAAKMEELVEHDAAALEEHLDDADAEDRRPDRADEARRTADRGDPEAAGPR